MIFWIESINMTDTDWDNIPELGKIPDVDLADKLNVSPQAVYQARNRRSIKALDPAKKCNIDWDTIVLGDRTDQHIADLLGCSGGYICKKRKEKGIPAFGMLYRTQENEAAYYEEAIIDMWLHNNDIDHKFQFKVEKYRVDWLVLKENEIWEFLGMWDHRIYGQEYRNNFAVKEKCLIENGYKVKRIYRSDIGDMKKSVDLSKIYGMSHFECRGCHRTNVKHQAKGLCAMCLERFHNNQPFGPPKIQFLKETDIFICEDCGSSNRHKRVKQKCHNCYDKYRRTHISNE